MEIVVLIVLVIAFPMIMTAVYITVRSQVFDTSPSSEFRVFTVNFLDAHIYKTANKNRIAMLLADKGMESYEYLHANIGVAKQVFDKYLDELQKERRVEELPNAGSATVYRLCD